MCNKPSQNIKSSTLNKGSGTRAPQPAIIEAVREESIGEELGFEPGDQIISINGATPRDLIDYQYLIA